MFPGMPGLLFDMHIVSRCFIRKENAIHVTCPRCNSTLTRSELRKGGLKLHRKNTRAYNGFARGQTLEDVVRTS